MRTAAHSYWRSGLGAAAGFSPPAAYGTADELSLAGVVADPSARLYFCRCHGHTEGHSSDLRSPHNLERGPRLSWRCDGHPFLRPGAIVDGDRIDDSTDFSSLVRRRLLNPRQDLPDQVEAHSPPPSFWLSRLHGLLLRSPDARPLGVLLQEAIVDQVVDEAPLIRYGVLNFLYLTRLSSERALTATDGARHLFRETVVLGSATYELASELAAVERLGDGDPAAALRRLRRQVLEGTGGRTGLLDLAEQDLPWLLEHVVEIYRAQPVLLSTLVRQVGRAEDRRTTALTRELLTAGAPPDAMRAIADRYLAGSAQDAVLAALA